MINVQTSKCIKTCLKWIATLPTIVPLVFGQNIMKSGHWRLENDAIMKKNRNPGMTQKRELKGYHINEPIK